VWGGGGTYLVWGKHIIITGNGTSRDAFGAADGRTQGLSEVPRRYYATPTGGTVTRMQGRLWGRCG